MTPLGKHEPSQPAIIQQELKAGRRPTVEIVARVTGGDTVDSHRVGGKKEDIGHNTKFEKWAVCASIVEHKLGELLTDDIEGIANDGERGWTGNLFGRRGWRRRRVDGIGRRGVSRGRRNSFNRVKCGSGGGRGVTGAREMTITGGRNRWEERRMRAGAHGERGGDPCSRGSRHHAGWGRR